MNAIVWFLIALTAIVLTGWIVSKVTGSKMWPLDDWKYDDGETIVWRDDAADVAAIPTMGQAVVMRPARLHRWKVVVTDRRILAANKALGGKHVVTYVLYPGPGAGDAANKLGGGLLTTGYQTIVIKPGVANRYTDQGYVALQPDPASASSTNLAEIRVYTDQLATFPLP